MRDYGRLSSAMWTKGSGKRIRGNFAAQAVACYLASAPGSHMLGLYHVTIATIASEMGHDQKVIREALAACAAAGLAFFDEEAELAWIPNVAAIEIGDGLAVKDKRREGIERYLKSIGEHPFVTAFRERYSAVFGIGEPGQSVPTGSPHSPPYARGGTPPCNGAGAGAGAGAGSGESREGPAPADTHVQADDPMPDFGLGVAAAVGLALGGRTIRDVPAEWLKFAGHYAGKLWRSDVRARWQKWLTKAAQDQAETDKRDRERAARAPVAYQAAAEARADTGYSKPPRGPSNREFRQHELEAVPPPTELLARIMEKL